MKRLITSNITSTASMPIRKATLDHLQAAWNSIGGSCIPGTIGKDYSPTGQWALLGCGNITPGGATYTIQAGGILYNNEFYVVDAVTVNTVGPQVPVAVIVTTYDATDPTEFTNAVSYNIHETKKITFVAGTSGSGEFDYGDLDFIAVTPDYVGSATGISYNSGYDDGGLGERVFYTRNRDGLVTIEGVVYANGTPAMGDHFFTLPVNHRPGTTRNFPCIVSTGGGFYTALLQVTTTGRVSAISTDAIFSPPLQWIDDTAIFINANYYE